MFCPNCGAESTLGLNFCKHCGGSLSDSSPSSPAPARNIFAALILALATAGIVLGGIAIVFNFALSLIGPQPPGYAPPVHDAIAVAMMMVLCGSGAIVFSTVMLIKLFAKVMGFGSNYEVPRPAKKTFTAGRNAAQLQAPPLSMHSVTEHTTRNFEPRVYQRDTSE